MHHLPQRVGLSQSNVRQTVKPEGWKCETHVCSINLLATNVTKTSLFLLSANQKIRCIAIRTIGNGLNHLIICEHRDMDFNTFYKNYQDLLKSTPKESNNILNSQESEYGDYIVNSKKVYYGFDSTRNVESGFLFDSHRNKNSFDLTYSMDNERCYELVDSIQSYNCAFGKNLEKSTNYIFSHALINCQNCLGCVELKNKNYCILNKQYTPSAYAKEKQSILNSIDLSALGQK